MLKRPPLGPAIRAFSKSGNFTKGQTWGQSENKRFFLFVSVHMSDTVAFKRRTVSDVAPAPAHEFNITNGLRDHGRKLI